MNDAQVVSFQVSGSEPILIETEPPVTAKFKVVGNAPTRPVPTSFEDALDRVRPAVSALFNRISNLEVRPSEIAVEFGIKFTAEAGALIAKASTEANFKVTMKWAKEN